MGEGKAREIIEIRSAAIDADEVLGALEENLEKRGDLYAALNRERPYLPSYDAFLALEPSVVSNAVGYHLWQATRLEMAVEKDLRPSRIPLFGRFVDRIKLEFHNLVLYYTNILSARQATAYANLILAVRFLAQELAYLRDQIGEGETQDGQEG